jgi:putative endonuclease
MANSTSASTAKALASAQRHPVLDLQQWALSRIDRLADRLGRISRLPAHLQTGVRGEEDALFFLRRLGYVIVARRWSTPKLRGDVDLIAWDGDWLCFIEVKTRTGRDIVPAEFAVDPAKQERLRQLARVYRTMLVRFDVVSVYFAPPEQPYTGDPVEFELFRSAFSR